MKLTAALKEWAVAIDALEQGKTICLLRKGGIREKGGRFDVDRQQVLLYPTYEHQKPELLKSEYADKVTPVESGWHPAKVNITSWAKITDILTLQTNKKVGAMPPCLPVANEVGAMPPSLPVANEVGAMPPCLPVADDSVFTSLSPFYIWNDRAIRDRFNWKPKQPLYLLCLRTYKLPQTQIISYSEQYGGCRSWIDLAQPISLEGSLPAIEQSHYQQMVHKIRQLIQSE